MKPVVAAATEAAMYNTTRYRLSKYFHPVRLHTHVQTSRREAGQRYPDLYISAQSKSFNSNQYTVFKCSTFLIEQERSFGPDFDGKVQQHNFPVKLQIVDERLAKLYWPSSHLLTGIGQVCEWLCNHMDDRSNHPICFVTDLNWWVFVTAELVAGGTRIKVSKPYTCTDAGHVLTALAKQAESGMYTPLPKDELYFNTGKTEEGNTETSTSASTATPRAPSTSTQRDGENMNSIPVPRGSRRTPFLKVLL